MPETDTIPVSASVASTGKGIRYVGQHCYAYSGLYEAKQSLQEVLNFTTGSGYIDCKIQLNGAVNATNPASRSATTGLIDFNGESVVLLACGNSAIDAPMTDSNRLIIPPFTNVTIAIDSDADTSTQFASVTIAGRVYGAV